MGLIKINGEIGWEVTASDVKRQLDEMTGDITIEISSPGGSVFQGVEIFNAIKNYSKGEVTTVIVSIAASMASYIALAGKTIKAYDNSVYMIHNASVYSWGDHRDLRKSADIVESLTKMLAKQYVAKTGKGIEEIRKMMDDETYLFGSEMIDLGFIDEIIVTENNKDKESAKILATENVKACIVSTKERQNREESNQEQIAALLVTVDEIDNKNDTINGQGNTQEKNHVKGEGEPMDNKFTQADLDAAVATAIASDRSRIASIIALDCDNDLKMRAIGADMSAGDVALQVMAIQKDLKTKAKNSFEASGTSATVETPVVVVEEDAESLKIKEAENALAGVK